MTEPVPLPLGNLTRFGILGGSFNPVHVGHLAIAQQVLAEAALEAVILMPAATPPHKQGDPDMASAEERLEMCRLAVRNMRGLGVSDLELKRGGVSYTVETARELRAAYGKDAQIRFIIGADSVAELPTWYRVRELVQCADFAIAARHEQPLDEALWDRIREQLGEEAARKLRRSVVPIERVEVSSTLIRQRLRAGQPLRGLLRRDVEEYIRRKGLYGAKPSR
ncbi:MAG: nicotinate (nicotinamide) nucleotide adenylyltransferase [Planctomycetota bacterium]|nr:nicotinate (nicotinamide) nucleotide adenylyltransferase [Planctomycetota bacterium]